MIPAALETLARALARLEPEVFKLTVYNGSWWLYHCENDGYELNLLDSDANAKVDDDRLLGAVWRCAAAQEWNCTVWNFYDRISAKIEFHAEIDPVSASAATPGVALALAFCAARGGKVEL